MTIVRHDALGEPGETHLGHELDCPKCFARLGDALRSPVPPPPPETPSWTGEHVTWHRVDPFLDGPGGTWAVGCACGWGDSGAYARDGMGEHAATRLAKLKAQRHRANPAEAAPDNRPHLMVPPDHTRTLDLNPVHTVKHAALTDPGHPGSGMWQAACSCGWQAGGRWGGPTDDIHDFTHARLKAEAEANAHLNEERT